MIGTDELCPRCGAQKDEGDTMCIDCIFEGATDPDLTAAEAEIARLTAALAQSRAETQAALAGCVKVKPLVWHEGDEPDEWKSGPYDVWREFGKFQLYYWSVVMGDPQETADAAKAAAQADHDARILAAIQPDTSKLALVREITVQEAAKALLSVDGKADATLVQIAEEIYAAGASMPRAIGEALRALAAIGEEPRHD